MIKFRKLVIKKLKEKDEATITLKSGKQFNTSNKTIAFKLIELYSEDIAKIE